jgi:hypothetical protein
LINSDNNTTFEIKTAKKGLKKFLDKRIYCLTINSDYKIDKKKILGVTKRPYPELKRKSFR